MNTFKELYDIANHNNKTMMLYLRKDENMSLLLNETSYLPSDISKSERFYCWLNNLTEIPKCPYCSKNRRFNKLDKGYFATCGDNECKSSAIIKSNKESYRDWYKIQEKMKQTYKERTGYEHNMQNPEFKEKFFDEYKQNHKGDSCGVQSEKSIKNRTKSFIEKYGTDNIGEILHSEQINNSIISKYGSIENFNKQRSLKSAKTRKDNELNILIDKLKEMNYTYINSFLKEDITPYIQVKCNRCNHIFEISRQSVNIYYRTKKFDFCPICDYKNNTYRSNFEKDVYETLKQILPENTEILTNKYINKVEVDILIPKYNIAIECNGLYWQSELYKDKSYHLNKKETIELNTNYNLIQIWEDDWFFKKDIVISRLKSKLGLCKKIYARKCTVKSISSNDAKLFLNENHLHGYINGSIHYGLYFNNELLEVISIGKSRKVISKNTNIKYELLRFASKQNITVIGGFSKLISQFKREYNENLFSYIDLSWSNLKASSYINSGFAYSNISSNEYWWVNSKERHPVRENRIKYQKSKLVAEGADNSKTEVEIMYENGYYRVFGPGNIIVTI